MSSTAETTQSITIREALEPVITALRKKLGERLIALVLFGSRARDEATVASDWDLLLITEELPQKSFDRHLFVKQLLPPFWRGVVSILAKTPEEFDASIQALYLDIAIDGVILFDKGSYMADRLALLNQQLATRGLYRTREGTELIWRWQSEPVGDWSFEWDEAPL